MRQAFGCALQARLAEQYRTIALLQLQLQKPLPGRGGSLKWTRGVASHSSNMRESAVPRGVRRGTRGGASTRAGVAAWVVLECAAARHVTAPAGTGDEAAPYLTLRRLALWLDGPTQQLRQLCVLADAVEGCEVRF